MIIENKAVVALSYVLEVDGKVVDQAGSDAPFDYIHGTCMIIPKLEATLDGMSAGQDFECTVSPEEGYGEYDMAKVFDVPMSTFMFKGELRKDLLEVGRYIPLLNSAGEVCRAMIVEVKEDSVTLDFNDPMAGKTLVFRGTILSVREATEKELLEGLHGEFLPPQGGCCHGGCHGNGGCHGDGGCKGDGGCCHGDGHECGCGEEGHECHCGEEGHECSCGKN